MTSGYEKAALLIAIPIIAALFAWLSFKFSSKNPGIKLAAFVLSFIMIILFFNIAFTFVYADYRLMADMFWTFDMVLIVLFGIFIIWNLLTYVWNSLSGGKLEGELG